MAENGSSSSFALQYKRTTSRPIDSTDVWGTKNEATAYARNTATEAQVPYAGQIIAVKETGLTYQLVPDDTVTDYPERKHFKLVVISNANDIDDAYLSRDKEDTAKELIHFMKGIDAKGTSTVENLTTSGTVKSADYSKGSSGYSIYKDADGNYHLEIYYLDVRGKMSVESMEIKQSYFVKGAQWQTKAGMIVSRVDGNKVYFTNHDADGNTITNDFMVGDMAYCKTFNLTENRMYWQEVTAKGADYIVLSGGLTDTIKPGDSIVQLGNRSDTTRQGATCIDTDSIKVYKGINTFTLPQPFIDLAPEGATIRAKFINEATGQSISDEIGKLNAGLNTVKNQTDKLYVLWFEDYTPTSGNPPANEWTTDALRAEHVEDMFYNTSRTAGQGGRAYRYVFEEGSYHWKEITDKDTIAALEQSAEAQKTADRKKQIFVSRPTTEQEYDTGDMWVNATYTGSGVSYENDELVCTTAKAAGEAFSITHWKPASTATTAVINNLGNQIVQVVSDLKDANEAIAAAGRLANQGISDANDAYRKALEAFGLAGDASGTASTNTTVIQQTKESITALANKIRFDSNGNVSNINTSGLVTTADFNTLLSKKVTFDSSGHVSNISTNGLVTTTAFAQMFSERAEADGYVKRAEISTFITEDGAGRLISNATIQADKINFIGKTMINGNFIVDTDGNLTVNGKITSIEGNIGPFSISEDGLISKSLVQTGYYTGLKLTADEIVFYNERTRTEVKMGGNSNWVTWEGVNYNVGINITSPNVLMGIHIDTPSIPLLVEGGNIALHPNISSYVSIHGLTLNARVVATSTTLNSNDDIISFTNTSNITVTMPNAYAGKVLFIKKYYTAKVTLTGGTFRSQVDGGTSTSFEPLQMSFMLVHDARGQWIIYYCG